MATESLFSLREDWEWKTPVLHVPSTFRCCSPVLLLLVFCLVLLRPLVLPPTVPVFEYSQASVTIQIINVNILLLWGLVRKQASLNSAFHPIPPHSSSPHTFTHVFFNPLTYFLLIANKIIRFLLKYLTSSNWSPILPHLPSEGRRHRCDREYEREPIAGAKTPSPPSIML